MGRQTSGQKILDRTVAGVPVLPDAPNFFINSAGIDITGKYKNFFSFPVIQILAKSLY
jgi:hypothetical protein